MPDDRSVEIALNINPAGAVDGVEEAVRAFEDGKRRIEGLAGDMGGGGSFGSPTSTPQAPFAPPPPGPASAPGGGFSSFPQPTTDRGIPAGPEGGGRLGDLRDRFSAIQAIAPNAPDVANMSLGRLQTSALNASLKDPDSAREYQELIDSIKQLRGTVADDGKKRKDDSGNMLQWLQANAMMSLGSQVMGNVQQGRLMSAAGTGIGGALGLLGGPGGMALGASIGGGIGGMIEQLMGGAGGARAFEKNITDMNQRFGLGNVGRLRNYRLGEENGYTGEESAGMIDQLRENRALSNPAMAGPLVGAIQEMTRALGLNAEATIEMAGIYSRSGGEKGAEGVRGYLADVVGGAIRAGFESNVQQYADMMGSARMQSVQATGQGMSDRAFNLLQDVMGGLTGGNSRTAGLFRDNTQMASMGLQSFMSYGGTADPYSTSAAYMRLAGIGEANLDSRFITPEQMAQNAQRSLGFTTNRLQQMSGMGGADFQARAAADPNFVQSLIAGNAGLQRQTSHIVSGFIGREANAQDLRAYEQLTNIAAANGGQLPMGGGSPDASRVDELLKQLQASPADEMREKEAARHNRTMEVMSHFMDLQTRIDDWMVNIMNWMLTLDLEKIQSAILGGMDMMEKGAKWLVEKAPIVGSALMAMSDRIIQWAEDNNLGGWISSTLNYIKQIPGAIAEAIANPGKVGQGIVATGGQAVDSEFGQNALRFNIPARVGVALGRQIFGAGQRETEVGEAARNFRGGNYGGYQVDDAFNDTPGSVTATPGYNTFNFAPGDIVTARQGGTSGGATLTDVNLTLVQGSVLGSQWHREDQEQRTLLQDVTEKIFETFTKVHADLETAVSKQFPGMIDLLGSLTKAAAVRDGLLAKIEQHFPAAIAAIGAVQDAIANLGLSMGGAGGGGAGGGGPLGAFASGLFTGPRANIGGSSSNHIDTKISSSLSWEEIDSYFMQMAEAYQQQGRRIEFSNSAVSGQVYDPTAEQADRIRLLQRVSAAHSHSVTQGFHSFDYYIPQGNDARSESANSSSAGAEMYLPSVAGGRVEYGSGGRYGNFANIYDANGNMIIRTGHGDNRRALPQARSFPTAAEAAAASVGGGGGGALRLGQGYESLQALSGELASRDRRFDPSTPEGRAAQVLALGIGGSEVYSRGSDPNARDFFTRRGGTGNNMLGFAQYNLAYHRAGTSNPDAYTDYLADMLTGERALPNGRQGGNVAARLAQAVQGGQISTGAQLEQWMRRQGLGGSNWQGVDDGWGRVPGLSDQLLRQLQGGGGSGPRASATGGTTNNIAVNVSIPAGANAGVAREAARAGTVAALDEFEQRRNVNSNPRNRGNLSPVYS